MKYWLMKSEPEVFSIDDLAQVKSSLWDGVRNYQARNFMTTDMKVGDEVLFYHSNAEPPGVAGRARVVGPAEPDPSQFDKKSEYFDPKAKRTEPRWFGIRLGFVEKFPRVIPLEELRADQRLREMQLLKKGQRLSIQPVSPEEFACICAIVKR
jgi:predicted RNA-binding protein with PUA-like domain